MAQIYRNKDFRADKEKLSCYNTIYKKVSGSAGNFFVSYEQSQLLKFAIVCSFNHFGTCIHVYLYTAVLSTASSC